MADQISKVEAGEEIKGFDPNGREVVVTAAEPCGENRGLWFCTTHPELGTLHQFQKDTHLRYDGPVHRLAWFCTEHGFETP